MKSMNDLMLNHLQDIYYAEKQGLRGMTKMAKTVQNPELKEAVLKHQEQTKEQINRLDQVFQFMNKKPRGKKCAAMDGLIQEANEAIDEGEKGPVLDAGLLAGAQAVDHYEMARYGAMVAWAKSLGMTEAADLLAQTLEEEKASDTLLNDIANRALNPQAAESEAPDEDDGEGEDESPEPEPAAAEEKPAPKRARAPARKPAAKAAAKPAPKAAPKRAARK